MYETPSSEDGDGGQKLAATTLFKFRSENGKESHVMVKDKPPSTSVRASTGDRRQWQQTSKEKLSGSRNGNGRCKSPSTTTVSEGNRRENQVIRKEKPVSTSVILRSGDQVQSQPMSKDKTSNSDNGNSGFKLPSTTSIISMAENGGENKGMTKGKPISTSVISEVGDRTQNKLVLKDKSSLSENGNSASRIALLDGYDTVQLCGRYAEYKYEENVTHLCDPSSSELQGRFDADGCTDRRTQPSNILVEPKTHTSILNENPASKEVWSGEPTAEVANIKVFNNSSISDTSMRKNVAAAENDHEDHLPGLPFNKRILVQEEDTTKTMRSKIVKCQETAERNKQSGVLMKIPEKESIGLGKMPSHGQMNSGNDNQVCDVVKTKLVESFDRACLVRLVTLIWPWWKAQIIWSCKRACHQFHFVNQRTKYLRGPDNRVWPVLYTEKGGVKALTSAWENLYHSNGLKEGDDCTFIPEERPEAYIFNYEPFYKVNIARKWDEIPSEL